MLVFHFSVFAFYVSSSEPGPPCFSLAFYSWHAPVQRAPAGGRGHIFLVLPPSGINLPNLQIWKFLIKSRFQSHVRNPEGVVMLASRDGSRGMCLLWFAAVPTMPYCLKSAILTTCVLSLVLWVFEFGVLLYDLCRRFSEQTSLHTEDSSFASPLLGRWPRLIGFCFTLALPNFRWPLLHSWGVG